MGITSELSRRITATKFADFPQEVVDYAKSLAMSALGATIAGATRECGQIFAGFVERAGGSPEAAVMGTHLRTNAETAAMVNATFAHSTEYEDDSFPEAVSTYTIFPVVFALAEQLHLSGQAVLEGFLVGYETQARIALACPEIRRRGMLTLSAAGTLGCAAAAAKMLSLDTVRTTMALSLAASQCSGLAHQTGTSAHTFEMGVAARNGVTAARLAQAGATGQADILEAPRGLFHVINGGIIPPVESIFDAWANPYRILDVGIKMYPCCYHLQRIIEAIIRLRRQHDIDADDVQEVTVEVNQFIPQVIQYPSPQNEDEAQFSLPHGVAVALLEDEVSPTSFSRAKLADQQFVDLRNRVTMIVRDDWGWATIGWTPNISIRMKSQRVFTASPERARGQPPNLLSFDDVFEKYDVCVKGNLDREQIVTSREALRELQDVNDFASLTEIVVVSK